MSAGPGQPGADAFLLSTNVFRALPTRRGNAADNRNAHTGAASRELAIKITVPVPALYQIDGPASIGHGLTVRDFRIDQNYGKHTVASTGTAVGPGPRTDGTIQVSHFFTENDSINFMI